MAKYKVNLDKVWNLPVGVGRFKKDGKYCALGLIFAGVFGEENLEDGFNGIPGGVLGLQLNSDMFTYAGISVISGIDFDNEVKMNPENKEMIREKYVRNILEKCVESGLFELEGLTVKQLLENSTVTKEEDAEQVKTPILS